MARPSNVKRSSLSIFADVMIGEALKIYTFLIPFGFKLAMASLSR
jgi:hypothetical protein